MAVIFFTFPDLWKSSPFSKSLELCDASGLQTMQCLGLWLDKPSESLSFSSSCKPENRNVVLVMLNFKFMIREFHVRVVRVCVYSLQTLCVQFTKIHKVLHVHLHVLHFTILSLSLYIINVKTYLNKQNISPVLVQLMNKVPCSNKNTDKSTLVKKSCKFFTLCKFLNMQILREFAHTK